MTAEQLRFTADMVSKYDPSVGVLDITTRMNLQLRGVQLEDVSEIINGLYDLGLTSLMRWGIFRCVEVISPGLRRTFRLPSSS